MVAKTWDFMVIRIDRMWAEGIWLQLGVWTKRSRRSATPATQLPSEGVSKLVHSTTQSILPIMESQQGWMVPRLTCSIGAETGSAGF